MEALTRFLGSTIGRKLVMSLTGLALVVFLIFHLLGNLLIFGGPDAFNAYAATLEGMGPLLWVGRFALLAVFVAHIVQALTLARVNRKARPEGYYGFGTAEHTSRKTLMSSHMLGTGLAIIAFVVIHLRDFSLGLHYPGKDGGRDLHRLVLEKFGDVVWVGAYMVFMLILGFHLWHGIHSAFQTLGAHHRRGWMRACQGLAAFLAVGFGLIPALVFMLGDSLS